MNVNNLRPYRGPLELANSRPSIERPTGSFGLDVVDGLVPSQSASDKLPQSIAAATSGWLGNGGCLDFTGSAVQVKSDMQNGGEGSVGVLGCTGSATEVKSDMRNGGAGSIGLLGCTGSATEVKSDMQNGGQGSIGVFGCTGSATDLKSGAPNTDFLIFGSI